MPEVSRTPLPHTGTGDRVVQHTEGRPAPDPAQLAVISDLDNLRPGVSGGLVDDGACTVIGQVRLVDDQDVDLAQRVTPQAFQGESQLGDRLGIDARFDLEVVHGDAGGRRSQYAQTF